MRPQGKYIAEHSRRGQGNRSFLAAVRESAGLLATPEDGTLESSYTLGRTTVYTFDTFTVHVSYPHAVLASGFHPAGTFFGAEYVTLWSGGSWWDAVEDWGDGLPLDGLCPVEGLHLPYAFSNFYQDSTFSFGGVTKKHIRADFDDDPALMDRFWYNVHKSEEAGGYTLAELPAFASIGPGTDVVANVMDVWMGAGLGSRVLMLDLRTGELGATVHEMATAYARREKPFGSVLVIRDRSYT